MVLFTGNIITICVGMLTIQMQLVEKFNFWYSKMMSFKPFRVYWSVFTLQFQTHFNFIELIVSMSELLVSTGLLLASCELAGRVSIGFEDLNDLMNQFDWYSFPREVQQMLPVVMLNAQQTICFKCFGSHLCNRETFKKVRFRNKHTKTCSYHHHSIDVRIF